MNNLKAGFARVNVNPPMGIPIRGYFKVRLAEAVLDDLEVNVLALQCGEVKTLLMSIDHCGIAQELNALSEKVRVRLQAFLWIILSFLQLILIPVLLLNLTLRMNS